MKRIRDILTRNKTAVVVKDDTRYKQVTIRTNYKGVCLRGTQDGSTILTKNQFAQPSANGAPHASPGQRTGNTAPQTPRAESPAQSRKHGL